MLESEVSELEAKQLKAGKRIDLMPWIVWGLAASFYFADYLARVAPGVMHRFLQQDFHINEAGFGLITASFYIPYILMQIPVGLTVDRLSIRKLLTVMSLVTALGCVVFGAANQLGMACLGRMLIGFSAAFAFISALRLATSWFPPMMLGLLSGLTQALGMLGAAAGEAPVAMMVEHLGWRGSLFAMSVLFIALSVLLYLFIRDEPKTYNHAAHATKETLSILESLASVLKHGQTWRNALYAGFLFAPTAVIGEAIGPAYLQYGHGLSAHEAAFATGLIFIGWGIGGPLSGWFSDKLSLRKPVMVCSALCGLVLSSTFVFLPHISVGLAYFIFFLFGFTNTGVAIAYAVSTEILPRKVVGTAIAFTNMASIFVGALMQPLVGGLIDSAAGSRAFHVQELGRLDFLSGLCILPVCSLIALLLVLGVKETHAKIIAEDTP